MCKIRAKSSKFGTMMEFDTLLFGEMPLDWKPAKRIDVNDLASVRAGVSPPAGISLKGVNAFDEAGFRRSQEEEIPGVYETQLGALLHGSARDADPDPFPVCPDVRCADGF